MGATTAYTRRGIQFERMFRITETLRRRRRIGLYELTREISSVTSHDWHARTIYRDLELLQYLALVRVRTGRAGKQSTCEWCGPELLAIPAECVGSAADATRQRVATLCDKIISGEDAEINAAFAARQ